jgi:hypothetical protein
MDQWHSAESGSRDCGRFFLDLVGQYTPGQINVAWCDAPRPTNDHVEKIIDKTWQAETNLASESNRRLFNGQLCRLVDCEADRQNLQLTLGPVSFKEFLGTNLTHAHLRYQYGPEVLGDALGVSGCVVTRDGFLLLGMRSQQVAYHPGRIHPFGGVVEPTDDPDCPPNPFETMTAELAEETALDVETIKHMSCLGLVRDKHIVQPELIFDIAVGADVSDLLAGLDRAEDAMEHAEFVPVRNHPAAVVTFIENRSADLTPVALAALLLHGMQSWGSGWFATARGYLRSMF